MKKKTSIAIIILSVFVIAFQSSPYARRIRPFISTPVACQENEIGYNMTSHTILICTNSGYQALTTGGSGSFAPVGAKYIVQTADGTLTNEQALSALSTGILKNTTTTGILSIAGASDVNSILPTQASHSGEFLTTNGTVSSWSVTSAGITNGAGNNIIPKSDGANLVASRITDDGTTIDANSNAGVFRAGDVGFNSNGVNLKLDDATNTVLIQSDGNNNTQALILDVAGGNGLVSLSAGGTTNTSRLQIEGNNQKIVIQTSKFISSSNGSTDLGESGSGFKQAFFDSTITTGGTTGAQTINKSAGSVNFAAAASSLVITSDKVTNNSIVLCTVATNDTTLKSVQCVPTSGSFTMFANAAATAETRVNFWILNQ